MLKMWAVVPRKFPIVKIESLPSHPRSGAWWAPLSLSASMALVGLYVGLSPLLVATFPVVVLACLRFAAGAILMTTWLRPPQGGRHPALAEHGLLAVQSLLGNVLFTLCALEGTRRAGALSAGIVLATIPACVALLSQIFLKERPDRNTRLAIGLSMASVVLLAIARHAANGSADMPLTGPERVDSADTGPGSDAVTVPDGLGILLLLGAVFCESSYVVAGKRLTAQLSPRQVTAWMNAWGLLWIAPLAAAPALAFDYPSVTVAQWSLFALYAVSASIITVWLWMHGLRHIPANRAGVFTVLLPLTAAAVGWGVLGEPLSVMHGLALGLAIAATLLGSRRPALS